jgi:hypothetical protein
MYSPQLGRFLQQDPNATAMTLMAAARHHGKTQSALAQSFSLELRYCDGQSVYQYLGSSSWNNSDAMGLVMWGDWMDTLNKGAEVLGLAQSLIDTHNFVMSEAADWAMDWSRPDDEINELSSIANAVSGRIDTEVDEIADAYAPLIAGTTSGLSGLKKAAQVITRVTAKAKNVFLKWLNKGEKNICVYMGKRNGKPYVGITNDIIRRGKEHGQELVEYVGGLTKNQARAIETQIIKANPHFDNQILSVADSRPFAKLAEEWALKHLSDLGKTLKP